MKNYTIIIIMILAISIASVGNVFAAPATVDYPVLLSVEYVPRKGPVFTFRVSGDLSKADLNGFVHVEDGADFELYCMQVDEETVKCTAPKVVQDVNVVVYLGEYIFWAYVPPARFSTPSSSSSMEYCYNVYDWMLDYSGDWMSFGTYCQDNLAEYGDWIYWYNPGWDDYYDYEFLPGTPECLFIIVEDAYYYPICPENEFPV